MRKIFLAVSIIAFCASAKSQKGFTPYVAVYAGGCVDNPFQFEAGIQKTIKPHLALAYDIHYWKTGYECYCDDMYSKGDYRSITPSVKLTYNTGKKEGRGLMATVGLGYTFAKDRGTEQTYLYDESLKTYNYGVATPAKWDFNSIAPSFTLGVGFRLFKLPVSFSSGYYFGNTTEGWTATAGGAGFKIGFRKID